MRMATVNGEFVKSGQVLRIITGALIAFLLMISGVQADPVGRAEAWFNNSAR